MATISSSTMPTLADLAKRMDPDGNISKVIEMMAQNNQVLDMMPWSECNDGTNHKTTVRNGLPTPVWRQLNYGVPSAKSSTTKVQDATGMLEIYAKIDKSLADLNNNSAGWRLSEEAPFREAMNQTLASTLFYGDTTSNPERFMGLAPRFADSTAENGRNIIKGGGAGSDNTSIWLVGWGENTAHGLYPKGSQAGLQVRDLGEDTASDGAGGEYQILRTHYKWDCGFTVRDWRYIVRICNIDVSDLTKNASAGADLIDLLAQALETIESLDGVRPALYGNRTIASFLRRQIVNKVASSTLTQGEVAGRRVMMVGEVPFYRTDAILSTEATVA